VAAGLAACGDSCFWHQQQYLLTPLFGTSNIWWHHCLAPAAIFGGTIVWHQQYLLTPFFGTSNIWWHQMILITLAPV